MRDRGQYHSLIWYGAEYTSNLSLKMTLTYKLDYSKVHHLRKSTSSRHAFGTMSRWMRNCQMDHAKCRFKIDSTTFYPTRLLYLGSEGGVIKLVTTATQRPTSPYLTLSHRWGSEKYEKLDSFTIHQFHRGINTSTLPLTFQEAIEVTRRLGFEYLWIDSLCIMQGDDDKLDWQREAPKMKEVYSNAWLNLSATGAASSSSSMFFDGDLKNMLPSSIELDIAGARQQYQLFDGRMWEDEVPSAPINCRGWVFQERMLARRVLHFGRRQLAWECRQLDAMEVFPDGLPPITGSTLQKRNVGTVLKVKGLQTNPLYFLRQPPILSVLVFLFFRISFVTCLLHLICFVLFLRDRIAEQNRKAEAYSLWQSMVEAYSRCSLTKSEDKLVALSGLAQSIRDVTGDEYLAGMWRRTMAFDLPWWRDTESRNLHPRNTTPYRAPSWSWASLDGEINFPTGTNDAEYITVVGANLSYISGEEITAGGLLKGSSVQVEGLLNTLVLHDLYVSGDMNFSALTISGNTFAISSAASTAFLHPEINPHELSVCNDEKALYCMACCKTSQEFCGILLAHCKQDRQYRRVGSFSINKRGVPSATNGEQEDEEWDILAIFNALVISSKAGCSLPCDFYDKKTGFYTITII
jgi:hypothetical protein